MWVTNSGAGTVSALTVPGNTVTEPITVGSSPMGVAVEATGSRVYVANYGSGTVSAINTATGAVTATLPGFAGTRGIAHQ